jgi:hypothetical protein
VWPIAEELVRALDAAIETVRELRGRMGRGGRKPKKPKLTSRRPSKQGPSKGCGTGAGGFKAGNQCAKESGGGPEKPRKIRIVTKKGTVPLPFDAKAYQKQEMAKSETHKAKMKAKKAALKKKKAVEKGEKGRKTLGKFKQILTKTAGKTKENLAKQKEKTSKIAEKKQKAAKGRKMLEKLKAKGEAAKQSLAEKKRLRDEAANKGKGNVDAKRKELDAVERKPNETDLDYHMRANQKDFDELRNKMEATHKKVESAQADLTRISGEKDMARTHYSSAQLTLKNADLAAGGNGNFLHDSNGTTIRPTGGAKLKAGDKEFDDFVSAKTALHAKEVEFDAAAKQLEKVKTASAAEMHDHIGALRLDRGASQGDTPAAISNKAELDKTNSWWRDSENHRGVTDKFYEPDAETHRSLGAAMTFYAKVAGARFSGILKSIRVGKVAANKGQFATRPGRIDNDYDLDNVAPLNATHDFIDAKGQKVSVTKQPIIGLRGLTDGERIVVDPKTGISTIVKDKVPTESKLRADEVAIHEIAHPLGQSASVNKLMNDLWAKRYVEHKRPKLKRYSSDSGREHQVTFDDSWYGGNYSAVTYPQEQARISGKNHKSPTYVSDNIGKWGDTELFTMGMQHIHTTPLEFMRADPEHFFATVGVITGRFVR